MFGKMITFGLGVVTGLFIAPTVQEFRGRFLEDADGPPEPTQVPSKLLDTPGEPIFHVEQISEPEDTTQFDAAVEAFLRTSADMTGEMLV